jgi:hypothetical protein
MRVGNLSKKFKGSKNHLLVIDVKSL